LGVGTLRWASWGAAVSLSIGGAGGGHPQNCRAKGMESTSVWQRVSNAE
jgi:hypothetical protein